MLGDLLLVPWLARIDTLPNTARECQLRNTKENRKINPEKSEKMASYHNFRKSGRLIWSFFTA